MLPIHTVHCQSDGDVRLVESAYINSGRVEVCIDSTWSSVCDIHWDDDDASIVCKQLGYSKFGKLRLNYHCFPLS